ncbi:AGE family epimerase/isomerase, partial [Methylobacterium trifolii]
SEQARRVLAHLREARAHPGGGFTEAGAGPLRQNPHMHLLEAALAWMEAGRPEPWTELADEMVGLATERFVDRQTGALFEFFEADWSPAGGRAAGVIEPGHQYEWAWLLERRTALGGQDFWEHQARLYAFAEEHGRDGLRGLALHDVDVTGRVTGRHARIWAQTERLRTSVMLLARRLERAPGACLGAAVESFCALEGFLDVPLRGLWRDRQDADGRFPDATAPASSFYHIVTGLTELIGFCEGAPLSRTPDA